MNTSTGSWRFWREMSARVSKSAADKMQEYVAFVDTKMKFLAIVEADKEK